MIGQAWAITWRYRFLWLLGVLAGGAVGVPSLSGSSTRAQPADIDQFNGSLADASRAIEAWTAANVGLLITLAVIGVALILVLLVLSFVAQGGMAQATTDLAEGHPSSLGRAWSTGLRVFWRYVGLWLVFAGAAIVLGALIAAVIAAIVGAVAVGVPALGVVLAGAAELVIVVGFTLFVLDITRERDISRWLVATAAAVFALPGVTVLLVVALTVSVIVAFAQRAIVVEDVGPIAAMQAGWRLARSHMGASLLTWLVNLALAFVAGVAVAVGAMSAIIVLGGIGVLMYVVAGLSAPTLVYAIVGCVFLLVGVLTLAGMTNAFFWTFWTLVYLRLRGRAPSPVAV